ncbi:MAG: hypothetical protein R2762_23850 [Bryobacteraceae bacterium]
MLRRSFLALTGARALAQPRRRTTVSIIGEKFHINGKPTYEGRTWNGHRIEGLLMNSRMIQGIFDDANPETVARWKVPGSAAWDAERNNREYVAAMPEWRRHGLLGFTIGLQGGSPEGYSKVQPWINSAFAPDGSLKAPFLRRFENILNRADELGMVTIANYFYFGQDERLDSAAAIERGTRDLTLWILRRGYRNVIVDLVNECDNRSYQQESLRAPNVHKLIEMVKGIRFEGRRLLVSTSFNGGSIPSDNVIAASDFVLMHGNGVKDPNRIAAMCETVRKSAAWRTMPILFNEDDHFEFDRPSNNMRKAIESYAGWGYFDPGKNDYVDGYQSMPVNWSINTDRKRAFFAFLQEVTGG